VPATPQGVVVSVQLLAILMTDLVGSTATRVEVGEDRAEALRREHDAMVRSVVEAGDGTVVKSTGDGVLATFPSAADAIAAAIAVQRRLDGLRVSAPDGAWAMRVGVSAGDVTVEAGDVFGTPVVEAARLCAAAATGEILATDMVQVMARGRAGDVFASRSELNLKGLAEPVSVCAVRWDASASTFPLPSLLATATDVELVGRADELGRLEAAWRDALAGRVTIALVSGEPGIGKTRLVSEFARARHAGGAAVLAGRCDEELGVPFEPFAGALAHLATAIPARELRTQLGAAAPLVARIVPGLSAQFPHADTDARPDPEIERAEFVEAVIGWLAQVSASAPVVLILDDLHWADSPSLHLLRALARDPRPARVLVLGTYREVELSRTHPLSDVLADLRRETSVARVSLGGLPEAEVASMVDNVGDDLLVPADAHLAAALAEATDGNPFFLLEMIRHLNENEWQVGATPAPGSEHAAARFSLPEGVREVIGKRLSRLSDAANDLLQVAAVIGRTFDIGVVVEVTERSELEVLALVKQAMAARLVGEVAGVIDRFEFTHALIQETLRTEVPTSLRVRLHRRIAEAIERLAGARLDAHLGALAFHYGEAAASGCVDEAVDYARRAAENAMQSLAFEDAVVYLERALAVAGLRDEPAPAERAALQLALAQAYFSLHDPDRVRPAAVAAVDAARTAGPAAAAELGAAAILLWLLNTYGGDALVADVSLIHEALAAVGEEHVAIRVELLDVLAFRMSVQLNAGDHSVHAAYADQAVALARMTGDPRLLADALCAHALVHTGPDFAARHRDTVAELTALEVTDLRGPMLGWGGSFLVRVRSALRDGDIAAFRSLVEETRAASRRSINPEIRYYPILWDTLGLLLEGRWREAEARSFEAVDALAGFDQSFALRNQFVQLIPVKAALGGLDELEPLLAAFAEADPSVPSFQCALANLHARLGRVAEAADRVAAIVDGGLDGIDRSSDTWLVSMSQLGDACVTVGDTSRAAVLYDHVTGVTNMNIVIGPCGCDGSFDRVLGRLAGLIGRWDDAEAHFATGRALEQRLEAPPLIARTDLHRAEMLLRSGRAGDTRRADELLGGATGTATRLEIHELLHDIEQLRTQ